MFKVNNKDANCSSVCTVNFEQAIVGWKLSSLILILSWIILKNG